MKGSRGGGRGYHKDVEGDVPVFILRTAGVLKPEFDAVAESPVLGQSSHDTNEVAFNAVVKSMIVVCWNANGMEEGRIDDAIAILDRGDRWDILLYPEGPMMESEAEKILASGHLWMSSQSGVNKRSVGVVLHRRWLRAGASTRFSASSSTLA